MRSQNAQPKWWQLYVLFPILIALFILENRLKISTRGHEAVQIGILLIVYGLIYWWLKSNSIALSRMDRQNYGRVIVLQVPNEVKGSHSLLQLTNSEIKGVLGDTFEMDTVDAKLIPIEHISEELKKE